MSDITPTAEDLARDLRADLEKFERVEGNEGTEWFLSVGEGSWPAAMRRALAAEQEVARLRATLAARDEADMERDEHT